MIGCQDIDDALHARPLPNGNIEAGVRESQHFLLLSDSRARTYLPSLTSFQTLPTSRTSFFLRIPWTRRLPLEERPSTSSTSESTCFPLFLERTCAPFDPTSSDWLSRVSGCVLSPLRIDPEPLTDLRLSFFSQEMTPEAEIVNVRFFKSVIASKAAFTYAEAQARLDDS